jgi:superfamily II DNA or RNA helicase
MNAPSLRPYQTEIITKFDGVRAAGNRRVILVAPTGAGKTIIAAEIIRRELLAFHDVLILSHRREITKQTSQKFLPREFRTALFRPGLIRDPWSGCRLPAFKRFIAAAF